MNDKPLDAQTVRFPHVPERTDAEKAWAGHAFVIVDDEAGSWREYSLERERQEIEEDLQWNLRRQANRPSPEADWDYYNNMDLWPIALAVTWIEAEGDAMATMTMWGSWEDLGPPPGHVAAATVLLQALTDDDVLRAKGIPASAPRANDLLNEEGFVAIDKAQWIDLRWDHSTKHCSNAHPVANSAVSYYRVGVIRATLMDWMERHGRNSKSNVVLTLESGATALLSEKSLAARDADALPNPEIIAAAKAFRASRAANSAGGTTSGRARQAQAQDWHAMALPQVKSRMARQRQMTHLEIADDILSNWIGADEVAPGRSALIKQIGVWKRQGDLPTRKK